MQLDWLALVAFLILTLAVGGISAFATRQGVKTWYRTLIKPSFNPPNWVFAPVWTILYILMGIAAWRVAGVVGAAAPPLVLFYVQLALNAAWSVIFFNAHRIAGALAEIVVLLMAVAATTIAFWQVDAIAGWLMAPYLAWVGFATVLNVAIWRLNPESVAISRG